MSNDDAATVAAEARYPIDPIRLGRYNRMTMVKDTLPFPILFSKFQYLKIMSENILALQIFSIEGHDTCRQGPPVKCFVLHKEHHLAEQSNSREV